MVLSREIEKKKCICYQVSLKDDVAIFTKHLFYHLFNEEQNIVELENQFIQILEKLEVNEGKSYWNNYQKAFAKIREKLDLDALAFVNTDPACKSLKEVYLAYPGFYAIAIYRLSHQLAQMNLDILARMMSEYAHSITGTDIHPAAIIGESFFIDHATGTVIGETTIIKDYVKIYQGVTLGGIQIKKSLAETKRHPTIESNVTIYANATILGGDVIIGANSIIGANVCVLKSIPENSIVTQQSEYKVLPRNIK
jgi:serine O-acetyltransferase